MGIEVGELFVKLGIKGSDKTLGEVDKLKKGLKDTASTSLEAKAAIVGAMYALERLFSASGQRGTDLTNLNSLLGVSAKTLQQYDYAARQVGVSNQEVEGSFKSLQGVMTKTLMGEGAPKGLARVAMMTGGMTAADINNFAKQPQLLIQKLQEYAQKETNDGLRNEVLKSFGLGDGMISALKRNAFRPEIMAKAPTYSDGEVKALDKANIAWSNLANKIEMAVGHFNAAHGGQLVKDISMITDKVIHLAEAFIHLAEKIKLFEGIGKVFEGWGLIFEGIGKAVDYLNDKGGKGGKGAGDGKGGPSANPGKSKSDDVGGFFDHLMDNFAHAYREPLSSATPDASDPIKGLKENFSKGDQNGLSKKESDVRKREIFDFWGSLIPLSSRPNDSRLPAPVTPLLPPPAKASAPNAPLVHPGPRQAAAGNVTVNQTLNFEHDGKDAGKTSQAVNHAVKSAYRQLSAQGQGS